MISKLNIVPLYVTDQERSREFYVDKLGFEVRTDAEMAPGQRWLEVAPKGVPRTAVHRRRDELAALERDRKGNLRSISSVRRVRGRAEWWV
ncbi:VOC family protein [Micromonospora sp. ATA32]|nr:VOC family protein [Micromonospora sp. ATA32]